MKPVTRAEKVRSNLALPCEISRRSPSFRSGSNSRLGIRTRNGLRTRRQPSKTASPPMALSSAQFAKRSAPTNARTPRSSGTTATGRTISSGKRTSRSARGRSFTLAPSLFFPHLGTVQPSRIGMARTSAQHVALERRRRGTKRRRDSLQLCFARTVGRTGASMVSSMCVRHGKRSR
jgi:hypothetical protein